MTSNYEKIYQKWVETRLSVEPEKDLTSRVMTRIRSRLVEVEQGSSKKHILFGRWAKWPLVAAMVLAVFFIILWPCDSPNTISWADVQKNLKNIHSLAAKVHVEVSNNVGKKINQHYSKIYIKDPGFLRCDVYDTAADIDITEQRPNLIVIWKRQSGFSEHLSIYPDSHRATKVTLNGPEFPSLPKQLDLASENWTIMKSITEDKTKRLGNRVIDNKPAVGFGFEVPGREIIATTYREAIGQASGQIWVGRDDGVPLLLEVEFLSAQGKNVRMEYSDIQWNVPLEESLFDLSEPKDWHFADYRIESVEYTGTMFNPNVSLSIGLDDQKPLATAGDVVGVARVEQQDIDFGSNLTVTIITIDLKPEAAERLHDYADAYPDKIIVVDFNGQRKVAARLEASRPTLISFDLNWLRLSLAELETKYFTTPIKRNKQ